MLSSDFIIEGSDRYRGQLIKSHIVGPTGTKIPDEVEKLASKHIKRRNNPDNRGSHYINQYHDEWYRRTGLADSWVDFWNKFKNYYRGQSLS